MAHYAFLDENNIVTEVIVGKNENDLATLPEGFDDWEQYYLTKRSAAYDCKRTSYNTINNQHLLNNTPFRGNYAGIGYTYDTSNDVFYGPKPYPSWLISEETNWIWKAPVDEPTLTQEEIDAQSYYQWNEETTSWDLVE